MTRRLGVSGKKTGPTLFPGTRAAIPYPRVATPRKNAKIIGGVPGPGGYP